MVTCNFLFEQLGQTLEETSTRDLLPVAMRLYHKLEECSYCSGYIRDRDLLKEELKLITDTIEERSIDY